MQKTSRHNGVTCADLDANVDEEIAEENECEKKKLHLTVSLVFLSGSERFDLFSNLNQSDENRDVHCEHTEQMNNADQSADDSPLRLKTSSTLSLRLASFLDVLEMKEGNHLPHILPS